MNQQIRELALQSGIAYLSEHTAYLTGNDGLTVLPSVDSLEKFAELIVKECITICEQGTQTQMTSSGAATHIKQYFGVE